MARWISGTAACVLGLLSLPPTALAQSKITIGYTSLAGVASVFVAKDNGYLAKHQIDAELLAVRGGHALVPSLVANSLQIATLTAPSLVQAADAGLNLVGLTSLSALTAGMKSSGLIARVGSNITTPQDLIGKKVAVGTIGSISQVLFDKWLISKGVDPKKLIYIEVAYPQMPDIIKTGSIDALIIPDPFMTAIVKAGTGAVLSYFFGELPDGTVSMTSASTRKWAAENPQLVSGYRASIEEAVTWIAANKDKTKEIVGKWLNLSPEIMASTEMDKPIGALTNADVQWWIDIMNEQKLLQTQVTPATLLVN